SPQRNLVTKPEPEFWPLPPSGQPRLGGVSACRNIHRRLGQALRKWCGRGRVVTAIRECPGLSFSLAGPGTVLRRLSPCAGGREIGPVGCNGIRDNSICDSRDKRRTRPFFSRQHRILPMLSGLSPRTLPNSRDA